ncbi:hypothetical protein [Paenibacillus illinoisensis]|uniref:hypothetical protein n=1 Tax=Paenibacillus illinoisensis TaxID=59845 RepID=UPI003D26E2A0
MSDYVLTSFVGRKAIIKYKGTQDIILEPVVNVQLVTHRHKSGVTEGFAFNSFVRFMKEDGSTAQYPNSKISLSDTEALLKEAGVQYEHVDEFI